MVLHLQEVPVSHILYYVLRLYPKFSYISMDVIGMGGSLSVAVNAAKTLACALGKPIIAVHHMVGYLTSKSLQYLYS